MKRIDFIKNHKTKLQVAISMSICVLFMAMTLYLSGNYIGFKKIEHLKEREVTLYHNMSNDLMASLKVEERKSISAQFSFDGVDAGKIVLGKNYDGVAVDWEYSLNGKDTWTPVFFNSDEEHKWPLTRKEIESINASDDIYVRIVEIDYIDIYKIDITEVLSPNVYVNDLENKIYGTSSATQWRFSESQDWLYFDDVEPDLTGNKKIFIRNAATANKAASRVYEFNFTDESDSQDKYVSVDHLKIKDFSSQNSFSEGASNVIDGRFDTVWKTVVNETGEGEFVTIEVDHPIYLSKFVYYPDQGSKSSQIISFNLEGSLDGENWEILKEEIEWTDIEGVKTIKLDSLTKVKYIRLSDIKSNGDHIGVSQFSLYEDASSLPKAEVKYSTSSFTNENVTATLYNLSDGAKVISDGGSNTHTFTKNGNFTFVIEDENTGARNYIKASVHNIDKTVPTAFVRYSTKKTTTASVIVALHTSEDVTIVSSSKVDYYSFNKNGSYNFKFVDRAGNVGNVIAKVNWIEEEKKPITPIVPETPSGSNKNEDNIKPSNNGNSSSINRLPVLTPIIKNPSTSKTEDMDDAETLVDLTIPVQEEQNNSISNLVNGSSSVDKEVRKQERTIIRTQREKSNYYAGAIFVIGILVSLIIIFSNKIEYPKRKTKVKTIKDGDRDLEVFQLTF